MSEYFHEVKDGMFQPTRRSQADCVVFETLQKKQLTAEFSTADQTAPPIDGQLANLVSVLCKDHLRKAKLDVVLQQYQLFGSSYIKLYVPLTVPCKGAKT